MAGATSGRLAFSGDFSIRGPLSLVNTPISGVGASSLFGPGPNPSAGIPAYRMPYSDVTLQGFSGSNKIFGVTRDQQCHAAARRVMLIPTCAPGVVIRDVFTGSDGLYTFNDLAAGTYTVWSLDPTGVDDCGIHGLVSAVPQ